MTYIEISNKFWQIHEEESFTTTEVALFFYLLKINNDCSYKDQAGTWIWRDSFKRNNSKIQSDLGISFNTMKNARNKLMQRNVIRFQSQNGSPSATYVSLNTTLSNYDEVTAEVRTRYARGLVGVGIEVALSKRDIEVEVEVDKNLDNQAPSVFFRFGNEIIKQLPSEYFKKNYQPTMESLLITHQLASSMGAALEKFDRDYPTGYKFDDGNHIINSFRRTLEAMNKPPASKPQYQKRQGSTEVEDY